MSQSSETTRALTDLVALNYPNQHIGSSYYTAMPVPGIGVCIAFFVGRTMVQFFPWVEGADGAYQGHAAYAKFIHDACCNAASVTRFLGDWPYFDLNTQTDVLTIKCAVEEGLKQKGIIHDGDQGIGTHAPTS